MASRFDAPQDPRLISVSIGTLLQFIIALLLAGLAWNMNQINQRLTSLESLRDRLILVESEVKAARSERMQQLTAIEVSLLRLEKASEAIAVKLDAHLGLKR